MIQSRAEAEGPKRIEKRRPMPKLLRRLIYWLRHRQLEADLAEELDFHRSMKQERLEHRGMTAVEARYASSRALGNATLAREDARAVWVWTWLDDLARDTIYALRSLRRSPAFATALIVVTALGIGATTSVFGLLDALVLAPLPVKNPDRLAWVRSPSFSYPLYTAMRERSGDMFSDFFAWNLESLHVDWDGQIEAEEVLTATGDFYSTLGVHPALGRTFDGNDDRIGGGPSGLVAVISHAAWQRRFGGNPSAIGRTIRIQGKPFTIVGVAPRGFFGVAAGLAPEITIPLLSLQDPEALKMTSSAWLHLMGRLRDGVRLEQAHAALQRIRPQILEVTTSPGAPADRRAKYLSRELGLASGRTGFSRVRRQFEEPLWLLLALVALLFTVGCASAANLLLSRGVARQRELAIRLAIGASRMRLIRQFFTESLVWAALGSVAAILVGIWVSQALVAMMATREEPIVLDVTPSWRVMVFTLTLTAVTVIICSMLPALRATRLAPHTTIKDAAHATGTVLRRWSLGKILVTSQVALTMVLLVGAALFVRSLAGVLSQDTGFDRNNILVIATDPTVAAYQDERIDAYYAQLRDRLASLPEVESASLSVMPPISDEDGNWTQAIAVERAPLGPDTGRFVYFNAVSPRYFATLGMRLLQGRDFSMADTSSNTRVVIVNESLARTYFPGVDALGHHITIGRDARRRDLEIVGIVADAKYQRLQESTRNIAYLPIAQHTAGNNLYAEVRSRGPASALIERVRREILAQDPGIPVRIETVTERIRMSLVKERVIAVLASGVGVAALVLACAGLYGLLAYAVSRQTMEIGLRLALGAERSAVLWMVLRDCLVVTGLGTVVGIGASLALGRFARTLLFQISTTDAVSLGVAICIMLAVALCAGFLPARAAARVDPATAVRGLDG
jgi:putative ABC transport system permease protein